MKWRPRTLSPRIALSVVVTIAATVSLTGTASASNSPMSVSCKRWQALHVTAANGGKYVVRNKPSVNHNDQGMCIADPGLRPGFTVTRSPGITASPTVRAYPYVGTGCFAGACATGRPNLRKAGSLGNYTVSWTTVTPKRSGVWNSSLDLWLGPHTGLGTSEVMIWLRYSKPSWWAGKYPKVKIDGARWYEVPHVTAPGRYYISFRRASVASGATLRLAPFIKAAEKRGVIRASWLLWSVQAGFEIWSGGRGLAITSFSTSH